uniref:Uncharacterized protein n=1 Tax=Fibrocapsa japonica TaxID=94617 RepID=A0A7S2V1D5_9STRA|mmetsp:Transcript_25/g.39  ORF Transcript_25/g.39 Transcript_25/m.39 type:complete len:283 (+) Transcript_25:70-918(+)|eukprot:CAMPEP_0113933724 /NCGR_PEP_ID=MMETSP1339-20121228/1033_1 /TAXON_ID=94617 /ORGANISM="Fibrocapsa japonica" /LENGTH=282 /DNA_ID=CAMNT_0000935167 /DNA_START=70 /DNA_END=918 /DNA_ORIENTATION=+ /assembly_acc=CAM_ASM_000762
MRNENDTSFYDSIGLYSPKKKASSYYDSAGLYGPLRYPDPARKKNTTTWSNWKLQAIISMVCLLALAGFGFVVVMRRRGQDFSSVVSSVFVDSYVPMTKNARRKVSENKAKILQGPEDDTSYGTIKGALHRMVDEYKMYLVPNDVPVSQKRWESMQMTKLKLRDASSVENKAIEATNAGKNAMATKPEDHISLVDSIRKSLQTPAVPMTKRFRSEHVDHPFHQEASIPGEDLPVPQDSIPAGWTQSTVDGEVVTVKKPKPRRLKRLMPVDAMDGIGHIHLVN